MVPIDTCWSVIVDLILVTELEFVREFLSWNTHEGTLIGEFPFGEIDRVSFVALLLRADSYIGLIFEVLHEYFRSGFSEIVPVQKII